MDSNGDKEGSVGEREPRRGAMAMFDRESVFMRDLQEVTEAIRASLEETTSSQKEALKLKQLARRVAWQEEVKAELDKRAEYKRQMEGTSQSQITDWKDKQTLSKISEKWRNDLKSERTQFLFNEVFPIISHHKITRWILTYDEIFICRLVSKVWKGAIDSSISTTSAHYNDLFVGLLHRNEVLLKHGCFQFFSVNQLQSFNRKCEQEYPGSNPFPFRQLYIGNLMTLSSVEGSNSLGLQYWLEMGKLLERWGKEIWMAVYVFDDGSIEVMYEHLIKYLSLMPNLRELAIIERDRSGNLQAGMLKSLGKDVLGPLKLVMERKSLPELPHLQSLFFGNLSPAPLVEAALAKYGDTLKSVKIEGPGWDNYSGEYVDLAHFAAGRKFPFTKYSCRYEDASRITHWNYQFPALNELTLDYLLVNEDPEEVKNIFKTVNSCGSTLRRLRLKFHFNTLVPKRESDWRDLIPRGLRLTLPHLEWLNLTVDGSRISSVDFLLPLASLKELTFTYRTISLGSKENDGKELELGLIQFAGYRNRLYDSNIWNMFPELKRITLHSIPICGPSEKFLSCREPGVHRLEFTNTTTTVHTRDGYRKHQHDHERRQRKIQQLTEHLTAFTLKPFQKNSCSELVRVTIK